MQTSFTFEIDNFSEKKGLIRSPTFLSGGCEWYLEVYPKGNNIEDHLSLYLCIANSESLRLGWKRRANFSFLLLDQSGIFRKHGNSTCKELYRKDLSDFPGCGWAKAVPIKELQEKCELIELTEAGFKLDWLKTKLDEMVSDLRAELSKEKTKSTTHKDDELESVVHSWEVLDYADLSN
ncbi:unnamed protein product [Thlaspi arvense]|uniref:MATH domain-containing protein n=1 Tax=Thlaspi arvense TaxID=13288 RepID=A0AAU9RRE9_THLAR|nr:unnamed protein product [Thlaspi arvense]